MQNPELTKKLHDAWERAFNGEKVEFSFEKSQKLELNGLFALLHNYRKKIRQKKLNPLYAEEWVRINSCRLELGVDSIRLFRMPDTYIERKIGTSKKKLPIALAQRL